ncbi:hypothetical protein DP939_38125 [Spongiactinospora rosea]|uniref:Integral membrane protein n=1 Tax=Spongiactinospora rosea TaxID=2248750 RepID=A0A366LM58_9ACTN|nr:hypothetical protein [Spongiactinospora rosea]RBQ15005.1 hypothetical protein DP939_38125 [Spongiactinospora rosea]
MKSWILAIAGVLLILLGGLWTLQGVGVVGGSVMTGDTTWAIIGPIVVVAGLVAAFFALRRRSGGG